MEWDFTLITYENISTRIMPAPGGLFPLLPADRNQRHGLTLKLRRLLPCAPAKMEHEHHPPQGLLLERARRDEVLLPHCQRRRHRRDLLPGPDYEGPIRQRNISVDRATLLQFQAIHFEGGQALPDGLLGCWSQQADYLPDLQCQWQYLNSRGGLR